MLFLTFIADSRCQAEQQSIQERLGSAEYNFKKGNLLKDLEMYNYIIQRWGSIENTVEGREKIFLENPNLRP